MDLGRDLLGEAEMGDCEDGDLGIKGAWWNMVENYWYLVGCVWDLAPFW